MPLDFQTTSISCQFTIATNHPVARNDDGERIGIVGIGYCTDGSRFSDTASQLLIGLGASVGNL